MVICLVYSCSHKIGREDCSFIALLYTVASSVGEVM